MGQHRKDHFRPLSLLALQRTPLVGHPVPGHCGLTTARMVLNWVLHLHSGLPRISFDLWQVRQQAQETARVLHREDC